MKFSSITLSLLAIEVSVTAAATCVTPPMNPVLDLDGLTYSGTGPWISSVDSFSCQLGSTSTFVSAENSFQFDGSRAGMIDCDYEIGPSRYPKLSIEVEFYYEKEDGLGWIVGSDNGGYDRSVIISDTRFGGIGQGIGSTYNSGIDYPSTGAWHHVVVVYDQNVANGSFLTLDGTKGSTTTANNNESRDSFSIGGDIQHANHGFDGYIRKVALYDKVLSDNDIANMYTDSCVSTGTCDQPNGGACESGSGAGGDPHIKTWFGEKYDFHGVCDLVLLSNPGFDNGRGMHIHIRNKRMRSWSYISTTAVSIGEDILQIKGGRDSMKYFLNGNEQDADSNNSDGVVDNFAGYKLKYQRISERAVEYEVVLENTELILLKTWNGFVSVTVKNPRKEHFGRSVGLMGSFPNGIKLARDNATIIDDADTFGQEWQVVGSEPKLFTEIEGPQFPIKCDIPSSADMRRRLATSIMPIETAKAVCMDVAKDEKDLCIFDVMVTNDSGLAGAY